MIKLCSILPNAGYFKLIIFKYETFIYDSNSNIIYNFCAFRDNILLHWEEYSLWEVNFLTLVIFQKKKHQNMQKSVR